jgi:Zn-dependent protease with chaperone function
LADTHPYLSMLLFAVAMAVILCGVRMLGIAIGIGGNIVRRSDNPEAFDLGLLGVGFVSAMLIVLMAFGQWAESNSDAATKAYLKRLDEGAAASKAVRRQGLPKSP